MNGRIADDKLKLIADWVLPPIPMFESGWDVDLYQSHMVRDMAREILAYRRMEMDFGLEVTRSVPNESVG